MRFSKASTLSTVEGPCRQTTQSQPVGVPFCRPRQGVCSALNKLKAATNSMHFSTSASSDGHFRFGRLQSSLEALRAQTASQQQQQQQQQEQQSSLQRSIPAEQPSAEHAHALSASEAKLKDLQGVLQKAEGAADREQRLQQTVDGLQRANAELDAALAQERERLKTLQAELDQAGTEAKSRLSELEAEKRDLASSVQVEKHPNALMGAYSEMRLHGQAVPSICAPPL